MKHDLEKLKKKHWLTISEAYELFEIHKYDGMLRAVINDEIHFFRDDRNMRIIAYAEIENWLNTKKKENRNGNE